MGKNSREKINEVRVVVARGGEERKIRTSLIAHRLVHAREGGRLCAVERFSPPKDYTARRSLKNNRVSRVKERIESKRKAGRANSTETHLHHMRIGLARLILLRQVLLS
jgi:hypothetical protein